MRLHSVYELTCLCGRFITTREIETVCPNCRLQIRIDWHPQEAERPKTEFNKNAGSLGASERAIRP